MAKIKSNKTQQVNVRLTEQELNIITAEAERVGSTPAQLMHQLLTDRIELLHQLNLVK